MKQQGEAEDKAALALLLGSFILLWILQGTLITWFIWI